MLSHHHHIRSSERRSTKLNITIEEAGLATADFTNSLSAVLTHLLRAVLARGVEGTYLSW